MATDRPTFSESWHRVAETRPRVRSVVRTYRQQFRGRMWHVFSDPSNNSFFRVNDAGYHFIALLDGRRTVAEAWAICNEQLGDEAPTQGEAIQMLGQLYTSNLLQGDVPVDVGQLFDRHQKRVRREVGAYLMNFLFIRIPLFDPNVILQRWVTAIGWAFSPIGFVLWLALMGTAFYFLVGRFGELWQGADPQLMLSPERVVGLYACFVIIKAIHEFGHGFACAHFGRKNGMGGPVHTVGIMLLVFAPVPYVDASSSWAFRNKWHRAFVGAAGMYAELALAAVAAIVWAHTGENTLTHALAYNMIFVAGVSTILFNGNPLLRFDGYYILSDLLEIANLAQRAKQHGYYVARKHAFGVRNVQPAAHSGGEGAWLGFYNVASTIYRFFICFAILLYIAGVMFFLGFVLAVAALITWVFVPIGKFIRYLLTNPELERVRPRALGVTGAIVGAIVVGIGVIPAPDRGRAEGIVEPVRAASVHMATPGILESVQQSGSRIGPGEAAMLTASNPDLESQLAELKAELRAVRIRRDVARADNPALMRAASEQVSALRQRIEQLEQRLADLEIRAPFEGVWVSRAMDNLTGVYLRRGHHVGWFLDPGDVYIRVVADQRLGPRVVAEYLADAQNVQTEVRVRGRPQMHSHGTIERIIASGRRQLPSPALSYLAGGSLQAASDDPSGRRASDPFFEFHIKPVSNGVDPVPVLRPGQRVMVRFEGPAKPLAAQWWRTARQVFQQRFSMGRDATEAG
ncbi:MAG: hypothetical protein WD294_11070 [Phycisphaeraceae bacterium]